MFSNRKLIIATKHEKEKVIAPLMEAALGVSCYVNDNFDTDLLGTFTGEIDRKLDPIATARQKCLLAMELSNCDLGIASEGSFGPHPTLFFASADDEFLIFIDKKNNLEIIARELSTETNFNGKCVKTEAELLEFAKVVHFPSHGIILRKSKEDNFDIYKLIQNQQQLLEIYRILRGKYSSVYAETDMRAMNNPTRMKVIAAATQKLIDKIKVVCPQCNTPGFGITDAKKGLKCSNCGSPTQSILSNIYTCQRCSYIKEEFYPQSKMVEEPMYCDFCNP